jgi:hypothetical protein
MQQMGMLQANATGGMKSSTMMYRAAYRATANDDAVFDGVGATGADD